MKMGLDLSLSHKNVQMYSRVDGWGKGGSVEMGMQVQDERVGNKRILCGCVVMDVLVRLSVCL